MQLAEILRQFQPGDALFVNGHSLFSDIIEWWTGKPQSHVAALVRGHLGAQPEQWFVLESMEGSGVRVLPLAPYLAWRAGRNETMTWKPMVNLAIDRAKVVDYLVGTLGESYSQPWQFAWSFTRAGRWLQHTFGLRAELDPTAPFCSWEYTQALVTGGWKSTSLKDPAEFSPGDVFGLPCLGEGAVLP